jgi:hypothetical protein
VNIGADAWVLPPGATNSIASGNWTATAALPVEILGFIFNEQKFPESSWDDEDLNISPAVQYPIFSGNGEK